MAKTNVGTVPGRYTRVGISVIELSQMFPDEAAATRWIELIVWPDDNRCCLRCGSDDTYEVAHKTMPYRCRGCKRYFSCKTGTSMQASKIPLLKWVWAIYIEMTSLQGVSSMKLHRDIKVTQTTAWFMLQRIREAFRLDVLPEFGGPVEVDETYVGGLEKNKHAHKKAILGRGHVGKTAVVGARDRARGSVAAKVVQNTDGPTLKGFIHEATEDGANVYTDNAEANKGLPNHEAVKHSLSEYVNGKAHTNDVESFWAVLKRAYHGVCHQLSPKHLQRYVSQIAGKHNVRHLDTADQMAHVVAAMVGKRLLWRELVAYSDS